MEFSSKPSHYSFLVVLFLIYAVSSNFSLTLEVSLRHIIFLRTSLACNHFFNRKYEKTLIYWCLKNVEFSSLNIIKCQSFYVPLFQCFTHMFKLQFKLLMLFSAAGKRYIEMFCRFVQTTVLRKDLFGFNFLYKVVLWAKDFDGKNLFHISRHVGRNLLFTTTSKRNWFISETLCLIN